MRRLLVLVCVVGLTSSTWAQDYPKIELKSNNIKMTVYPPDAKAGFYRGSRFSWAGVLGDVEFAGHKIFHKWKDTHDPKNNDDIIGPVEEYGMQEPLGYADAKVGETFLKIGVGELEKVQEEKYRFSHNYKIVNTGLWKVRDYTKEKEVDQKVTFRQTIQTKSGYGYHYEKTIQLAGIAPNTPLLILTTRLVNIGTKPIETNVYNHNFFNVDSAPVGAAYGLLLARGQVTVKPAPDSAFGEACQVKGNNVRFIRELQKESAFGLIVPEGGPKDFVEMQRFGLRYIPEEKSGIEITVENSLPIDKFQFWSIRTTMCPEPFSKLSIEPGDAVEFKTQYQFTQILRK